MRSSNAVRGVISTRRFRREASPLSEWGLGRGQSVREHVVLLRALVRDQGLHRAAEERGVSVVCCADQGEEEIGACHGFS
jgi:hypothetical protein